MNVWDNIKVAQMAKTSFTDMVSIVIRVVYRTNAFENASNIEIAY